ncbi:MAG: PAS-domain containing protein [Hyphomicrobiales bacterium]|nr:PAS-domain containing protein [Hyphomicrobiales bacterium]
MPAAVAGDAAFAATPPMFSLGQIGQTQGVAGISVFVALVIFSASTAILHLTGRSRWTQREAQLTADLTKARAALDRANVFLSAEPQIVIAWSSSTGDPEIEGDFSLIMDTPVPRRVLGFGSWLPPDMAQSFEGHVGRLRARGESFRMPLVSLAGRHLEAEGRAVGGRAVMRIRDVSGDRLELTQLRDRHGYMLMEFDAVRGMLDAIPNPAWMRNNEGKLTWTNRAYAEAVEAGAPVEAVSKGTELLDQSARDAARKAKAANAVWQDKVSAVVAGQRRKLDAIEVPSLYGSVGMAADISELESIRRDLGQQTEAHARTLDQLTTAVAMFDGKKRLVFYNAAYRQLWSLDPAFLDQRPSDPEILDRLRSERKLPEQADFRAWREDMMTCYQRNDTVEHIWYLPDNRSLRVVANPNPQGGVTYLFDDVTERYQIESQYNALIRVQSETLDTLREGVAVFGSDGCLKLYNPAFPAMWKLQEGALDGQPHIDAVAKLCEQLDPDGESWQQLRAVVAGLHDQRTGFETRIACLDDLIIDCATAPLSDGATLLTFTDVSASVLGEKALTEKNQALELAEKLRNEFVHHVSYELRSPLTNIIGYAELLTNEAVGALNSKQREYAGHVAQSSAALLAIINDILDLATIDHDAMDLVEEEVDIQATIKAAAEGVQDRLSEADIKLQIVTGDNIGSFLADGKRMRQVLFNLLSNAIGFSEPGQTVTLSAFRRDGQIIFKVADQGRGIPAELLEQVFNRFHSHTVGSRHRGAGLGLSIVQSFVELHGGDVLIDSAPGEGTVVTCIFPAREVPAQAVEYKGGETA